MKTDTKLFVVAGLLVGLALAVFVSPFASSSPDGLEKVAEEEGFADSATEHQLDDSPLADYAVDGVDDESISTGASGLIGVLLTLGVTAGILAIVRTLRRSDEGDSESRRGPPSTTTASTA